MRHLLLLCLLCCSAMAFSQKRINDSADLNIERQFLDSGTNNNIQYSDFTSFKYLVVKIPAKNIEIFKKKFSKTIKRQLTARWFIVTANDWKNIYQSKLTEDIWPANANWKLSPSLLQNQNSLPGKANTFLVEVTDTTAFKALINQYSSKAKLVSGQSAYQLFRVRTDIDFVKDVLLASDLVNAVDLRLTSAKEETVINEYDNSTNGINLLFAKYPAISGTGLTVSVKENMFDKTDIDFTGRYKVTTLESGTNTSHATTMATLIGGGGNSFFTGKGVAPAALIASSSFATLLPDGNSYQQYGISIQNHSYGVGIENFYASDAAAYDASMIANPTLLHVFSAGNVGTVADTLTTSPYRNIAGFANISGSFKMAKNILTVGSVDSFFNVPALSSKGPAYDGRIKPELVAYGNDGSSGAAAITSGTVLAVQSAYAQQHSGDLPANALTKATIINSADDINKKGPDFYSGYGNVNSYRAVQDILSGNYFTASINDGETKDFALTIPANAKNLKLTLVWTDPAAQTNAFTALVNDLDLQLQKETTTWLPWVLNSAANADSLNQVAKRKRDSLNVVEQITLDNPFSGNYTIHVKGYNITDGPQEFYIAYRWDSANTFYFISPAAQDHFTSGSASIFRWKSTYAENTTGKLEYSIDKGVNWKLINNEVNLDDNYYKWITPDTFTIALARITIGSDVYVSDTFNFSKQLFPEVGFNCADSVLIFWNKASGVNQYRFYTLGNKYLQTLATTADTSITISTGLSPYVAVATVLQDGYTGVNSYAFNYNNLGTGCYISNFLADLTVNKTAQLQLSLGTIFNVSSIQFQQLTPNGWQTIQTISPVTDAETSYEDNGLHAGTNTYRAVITLNNGSTLSSSEATVYFTGSNTFVLMPNPVPRGQNLTILSNNFITSTVVLYDITGRKVLQQNISGTRSDIAISHLAKGIYMVAIYAEGERLFTSKIALL